MKPRRPQVKAKRGQKQDKKERQTLVFNQSERIDFVKGFQKRKQERRERAKQEAAEQEREIRKLLRQKRREALKRAQLVAVSGNEVADDEGDDDNHREVKSDGVDGADGGDGVEVQLPLYSGDIE